MLKDLSTKFFVAIQYPGDLYPTTVGIYQSISLALGHYQDLKLGKCDHEIILGMSSK